MDAHIRIRATWGAQWLWELITAKGHIVSESQPFADRAACEADAKEQGLPVKGLIKRGKKPAMSADADRSKWRFPRDPSGVWQWQRLDSAGALIEESSRAFLTKEECVTDAVKNGYTGRTTPEFPTSPKRPRRDDDLPSST